MPHLSPMNWLMMLFILWSTIFILLTSLFYTCTPLFEPPYYAKQANQVNFWSWSLQGGRIKQ